MGEKHGLDKEIADKLSKKYDAQMESEAIKWIEDITGDPLTSTEVPEGVSGKHGMKLHHLLKSGVSLCRLANALQPGLIKKFAPNPGHVLEERNNIQQYLVACARLMIPEADLFSIGDLHEAKDMTQVLQNIFAVGRQAQVLEGFEGPRLGVKFTTSLQVQKERKHKRKMEEIFAQEKQIEREEEALNRRRKLETRQLSISEDRYNEEEKRATKRRLRRGDTMKEDTHSMRHRRFEADDVKFGLDAETKEALEAKYDIRSEQHVLDWIELLTGETLDYFYEGLRSGVVLCKLLNSIRPGIIKDISEKPVPLMERENLKKYLRAAQGAFALNSFELFVVSDLYDKKNLSAVLTNIRAIARKAESISSFPGPQLRDVEEGRVSVSSINIADTEIADAEHVAETFKKKPIGGAKALQDLFAASGPTTSSASSTPEPSTSGNSGSLDGSEDRDDEIERLQALLDASKGKGGGKRAKLGDMKKMMEQLEADRKAKHDAMAAEEEEIRKEEEKLKQMQQESSRRRAAFATARSKTTTAASTEEVLVPASHTAHPHHHHKHESHADNSTASASTDAELEAEAARQIMEEIARDVKELKRSASTTLSPGYRGGVKQPGAGDLLIHYPVDTVSAANSDDEGDLLAGSSSASSLIAPEDLAETRMRSHSVSEAFAPPRISAAALAAQEEADRNERLERRRRHRLAMEEQERAEEEARVRRETERKTRREQREAEERAMAAETDQATERRRLKREESIRAEAEAEAARQRALEERQAQQVKKQAEDAEREREEAEARAAAQLEYQKRLDAKALAEKEEMEREEAAREERRLAVAKAAQEAEEEARRREEEEDRIREERKRELAALEEAERRKEEEERLAAAAARAAETIRQQQEEERRRLDEEQALAERLRKAEEEIQRLEAEKIKREAEEERQRLALEAKKEEEARMERERAAEREAARLRREEEARRLAEEEAAIAAEEARFALELQKKKEEQAIREVEIRKKREEERLVREKEEQEKARIAAERAKQLEQEHIENERRQDAERKAQREAEEKLMALALKRQEESRAADAERRRKQQEEDQRNGNNGSRPGTPKKSGTTVTYASPKLASPKKAPGTPTRGSSSTNTGPEDPVALDLEPPLGPDPKIDRSENESLLPQRRGCPCVIL